MNIGDSLNLNIVYSVYETPRTKEEIAEELGMTPVFLEEKIDFLEKNGFLVKLKDGHYTTYVRFSPRKFSLEPADRMAQTKQTIVKRLLESYVPKVRAAIADLKDVYIPGDNWELFEAAAIFYAISEKCHLPIQRDVSKYWIKTLGGADYSVSVNLDSTPEDPEYQCKTPDNGKSYNACGSMTIFTMMYFYIGNMEAMMVLDELYDTGIFKPLSENEKVTSQLIMFADRLPE